MVRNTRLFVLLSIPAGFVAFALVLAFISHSAFYARCPHVERVRRFADAPEYAREVQTVNGYILEMREYNRRWYLDWAVPDGWNDIPLIETGDDLAKRRLRLR
jgi:hypothetical protein